MNTIDFSQTSAWLECQLKWYEKYIKGINRRWDAGQRDDAMAIGTLVHAALDNWYLNHSPAIPKQLIEEIGPTPEALNLCKKLVDGYVLEFPNDPWEVQVTEEPLRRSLVSHTEMLAKVDNVFKVGSVTDIDTGLSETATLEAGHWAQEFKTKSGGTSRSQFVADWLVNMQADFQILCAREHFEDVQGVLVTVLEKPKAYSPKRKCSVCDVSFDFSSWLPIPDDDKHLCPKCGTARKLKAVDNEALNRPPSYFRFPIRRTERRLKMNVEVIERIAGEMQELRKGTKFPMANWQACAPRWQYWKCEFFEPHEKLISPLAMPNEFVQIENPLKYTEADEQ